MLENLSYQNFDQQMGNLLASTNALITGWTDITTLEMTLDLKSLCLKASRLCVMADTDFVLQQQEVTHLRTQQNEAWCVALDAMITQELAPLVKQVVEGIRQTNTMEGRKSEMMPNEMALLLPHIAEMLEASGVRGESMDVLIANTAEVEKIMSKKMGAVRFPGLDYRQRFWLLYEFYTLMCYLLLHFRRVMKLTAAEQLPTEDVGERLQATLDYYRRSDEGKYELDRYWETLTFRKAVTERLIDDAERELVCQMPQSLQLAVIRHADDLRTLATEIQQASITPEEFYRFIALMAKWQKLENERLLLTHPQLATPELYNEVFKLTVKGKPVRLKELRERIGKLALSMDKKNQWLCIWSVLNFRGYLSDTSLSAFARQMMHPDWFGNDRKVLSFTADTLNEYSGYFTDHLFTLWQQNSYDQYRELHSKKKWGDSLCEKFRNTCERMDKEFIAQGNHQ